jgi:transposase
MDFDGICGFRIFDGRLNQHAYLDILNRELLPTITREQMNGIQSVFQQDNAPCHRAKTVEKWFTDNKITKLTWPANSPDLNCIENLWSWLDSQISKANPQNLDQLKSCVVNHLENVPKSIIENLIDSMPNRINECLKNKGGITRY